MLVAARSKYSQIIEYNLPRENAMVDIVPNAPEWDSKILKRNNILFSFSLNINTKATNLCTNIQFENCLGPFGMLFSATAVILYTLGERRSSKN